MEADSEADREKAAVVMGGNTLPDALAFMNVNPQRGVGHLVLSGPRGRNHGVLLSAGRERRGEGARPRVSVLYESLV